MPPILKRGKNLEAPDREEHQGKGGMSDRRPWDVGELAKRRVYAKDRKVETHDIDGMGGR